MLTGADNAEKRWLSSVLLGILSVCPASPLLRHANIATNLVNARIVATP